MSVEIEELIKVSEGLLAEHPGLGEVRTALYGLYRQQIDKDFTEFLGSRSPLLRDATIILLEKAVALNDSSRSSDYIDAQYKLSALHFHGGRNSQASLAAHLAQAAQKSSLYPTLESTHRLLEEIFKAGLCCEKAALGLGTLFAKAGDHYSDNLGIYVWGPNLERAALCYQNALSFEKYLSPLRVASLILKLSWVLQIAKQDRATSDAAQLAVELLKTNFINTKISHPLFPEDVAGLANMLSEYYENRDSVFSDSQKSFSRLTVIRRLITSLDTWLLLDLPNEFVFGLQADFQSALHTYLRSSEVAIVFDSPGISAPESDIQSQVSHLLEVGEKKIEVASSSLQSSVIRVIAELHNHWGNYLFAMHCHDACARLEETLGTLTLPSTEHLREVALQITSSRFSPEISETIGKHWSRSRDLFLMLGDSKNVEVEFKLRAICPTIYNQKTDLSKNAKAFFNSLSSPALEKMLRRLHAVILLATHQPELVEFISEGYLALGERELSSCNGAQIVSDFNLSIEYFLRALELNPRSEATRFREAYYTLAVTMMMQGRHDYALQLISHTLKNHKAALNDHPLGATNIRCFQNRSLNLRSLGNLISEPEYFIKMRTLGWFSDTILPVLLAPSDRVINKKAGSLWRNEICCVTDTRLAARLKSLAGELEYNTFWVNVPRIGLCSQWASMLAIQNEWEQRKLSPLTSLTEQEKVRGNALLRAMGIPEGAWFVTLHVRSQTQVINTEKRSTYNSHRDASINSYLPAIEEITKRGGWVVRVGDSTMERLPHDLKNVIDYPHTPFKSEFMDIFTIASSRFFIGSASGMYAVAIAYGVPTLSSNGSPMNSFPVSTYDLYLPKLLRSKASNELLTFGSSLVPPFNYCHHTNAYHTMGVELVDNTEDEIRDATIEMLEQILGLQFTVPRDEELQNKFRRIANSAEPSGIQCRVANSFLIKHSTLIR